MHAKCEVPIMCSLKGIDINVTGKYGYQMKALYQIMSIFEFELGIAMEHFYESFEEPIFRHSGVMILTDTQRHVKYYFHVAHSVIMYQLSKKAINFQVFDKQCWSSEKK